MCLKESLSLAADMLSAAFFCICNPPIVPELIMKWLVMATLYFDWGGFGFSNLVDVAEEIKPYRLSIGLKMNLK